MEIVHYKQVLQFREDHKNCQLETKLTNDDKATVVIRCAYHSQMILTYIPYRQFCHQIAKCAGFSSCPRDYACSE